MYYIYEMQMPEEDLQMLKTVAAKDRISVNDLFNEVPCAGSAACSGQP